MSDEGAKDREETRDEVKKIIQKKKRKSEPEVTIGPTQPGGPDISVE